MAASLLDMEVLATDATFQNRVQTAIVSAALAISTENPTTVPFHAARKQLASSILLGPTGTVNYKSLFSISVASDATVSSQASTQAGGPITTANVAAAAAAVTDAAINAAVSSQWNSFISSI
jgi:hypothetical protein